MSYAERQTKKAERLRRLAERTRQEAVETRATAERMVDVIPFGQPILVGHYSEQSDRNFRDRINRKFEKASELKEHAEVYEKRAERIENPDTISSDDPEAVTKLEAKVLELEAERTRARGMTDAEAWRLMFGGEYDPERTRGMNPPRKLYLESLGRKIRATKERIEDVKARRSVGEGRQIINGIEVIVDQSDNRVKIIFPSIPPLEIREKLKQNGFRWSPFNKAWQRQISNSAVYWAEEIVKGMNPLQQVEPKEERML